jgi:hypothetical protein
MALIHRGEESECLQMRSAARRKLRSYYTQTPNRPGVWEGEDDRQGAGGGLASPRPSIHKAYLLNVRLLTPNNYIVAG